jgi:hypothetical protein
MGMVAMRLVDSHDGCREAGAIVGASRRITPDRIGAMRFKSFFRGTSSSQKRPAPLGVIHHQNL